MVMKIALLVAVAACFLVVVFAQPGRGPPGRGGPFGRREEHDDDDDHDRDHDHDHDDDHHGPGRGGRGGPFGRPGRGGRGGPFGRPGRGPMPPPPPPPRPQPGPGESGDEHLLFCIDSTNGRTVIIDLRNKTDSSTTPSGPVSGSTTFQPDFSSTTISGSSPVTGFSSTMDSSTTDSSTFTTPSGTSTTL